MSSLRKSIEGLIMSLVVVTAMAQGSDINHAIDATLGDHAKYQTVVNALQKAVATHDVVGVAELVRYPIGVRVKGKNIVVRSRREFIKHYDDIIIPSIAKTVTQQRYEELAVSYRGLMFGSGDVWVNGICQDSKCKEFVVKVVTIQSTEDLDSK